MFSVPQGRKNTFSYRLCSFLFFHGNTKPVRTYFYFSAPCRLVRIRPCTEHRQCRESSNPSLVSRRLRRRGNFFLIYLCPCRGGPSFSAGKKKQKAASPQGLDPLILLRGEIIFRYDLSICVLWQAPWADAAADVYPRKLSEAPTVSPRGTPAGSSGGGVGGESEDESGSGAGDSSGGWAQR